MEDIAARAGTFHAASGPGRRHDSHARSSAAGHSTDGLLSHRRTGYPDALRSGGACNQPRIKKLFRTPGMPVQLDIDAKHRSVNINAEVFHTPGVVLVRIK